MLLRFQTTTQDTVHSLQGKVRMNDHDHADTLQGASGVSASPAAAPTLVLGSQYLRTLSIDVQNTPDIYRDISGEPHIGMTVDVTARQLPGGHPNFEVTLVIRAQGLDAPQSATHNARTLYELQIAYAGLFALSGLVTQADVEPLLLVNAPGYLFPSARMILLNTIREAGFPVGNIQPINFHDLWQSRRTQQN
ncbi:protein-export chaperone SecB [Gluconobacter cerinus]|uniref:Preprotein translocase subunit SecB n=2 Tax=Acetobacteraceae TaxID=433 RepID=A0AAV5NBD9_9PROT|nr:MULTISPECIES: protein-export chaperone SecB [Gluconobacter]MBM3099005.1 protein-export chaperone SecB [Gluconobacter cerinus]MBS1019423.1 protein-export chaperone SecB [Gluconobacter cerinus]MBS1032009.1 protein-export chaperone SecB [Gluconobacter cerinus]MBS1035280.1 protein-export chaperone SecB [Gluconobacter cerinus]MBS1037847.1 protein-export chaperone SecB [Gluconobacter cerinus]